MLLASRLRLPAETRALLLDMDGVLVDTLSIEFQLLNELLARHIDGVPPFDRELVRSVFPYSIPEAWRRLLVASGHAPEPRLVETLTRELERERELQTFPVHTGMREIVASATDAGLRLAVVSNNPVAQIEQLLGHSGMSFDAVIGNDRSDIRSKPAPDPFLAAAAALGVEPRLCAAVEDSLLGAQSAHAAGCFVVGVATGAATFEELAASPHIARAYTSFQTPEVILTPGEVTSKDFVTPNEFVSHMVEHVAWRLGCGIRLAWYCDDWRWLGTTVGGAIAPLLDGADAGAALGMIDDGSAEVYVERSLEPDVAIVGAASDAEWFIGLRCEQLADGRPLVSMLSGLAEAAGVSVRVDVVSVEDPHHTWEGIWRGVGLALRDLSRTLTEMTSEHGSPSDESLSFSYGFPAGIDVIDASIDAVNVRRTTAESVCEVDLNVDAPTLSCEFSTSHSIAPGGLGELLTALSRQAGLGGEVRFTALNLSSSHVVAEDVGLTLGAALRVLAIQRMHSNGIEGAGSSIALGRHPRPIRVGISFEGRKFVKFVPIGWSYERFRRHLIGRTLSSGLFSEDLDDFLEGLAGGMACSIIVHWEPFDDPDQAWRYVFEGVGAAFAGLLAANHARRGLTAGVKATLA